MSTDKPPEPDRGLPDDEADRLTYEAMRRDGRFVPQSPDEVAKAEAEIDEAAVALNRVTGEQAVAKQESRKPLDAELAAEAELRRLYWEAREKARKVIAEKEFVVRLTGPAHVQPGAPNKWQIETLRHGLIARPN